MLTANHCPGCTSPFSDPPPCDRPGDCPYYQEDPKPKPQTVYRYTKLVGNLNQLRRSCPEVTKDDPLEDWLADMFIYLSGIKAQGLAANQIGINARIFIQFFQNMAPTAILNPMIIKTKGSVHSPETCLSLPGVKVELIRPERVRIKGFNRYWQPVDMTLKGIEARRACHEIDHLDGRLIIDYHKYPDGSVRYAYPFRPDQVGPHYIDPKTGEVRIREEEIGSVQA